MVKHGTLKSGVIDVIRYVLLMHSLIGEYGVQSFSFAPYGSSYRGAGIWARPDYALGNGVNVQFQKNQNSQKFGLDSSTKLLLSNVNTATEEEEDEKNNLSSSSKPNNIFGAAVPTADTGRRAFLSALAAVPMSIALAPPQEADAIFPFSHFKNQVGYQSFQIQMRQRHRPCGSPIGRERCSRRALVLRVVY